MYLITPELVNAINEGRLSDAEEKRMARSVRSRSGFIQALQRIVLSALKR